MKRVYCFEVIEGELVGRACWPNLRAWKDPDDGKSRNSERFVITNADNIEALLITIESYFPAEVRRWLDWWQ